jgi:hypothetical protein
MFNANLNMHDLPAPLTMVMIGSGLKQATPLPDHYKKFINWGRSDVHQPALNWIIIGSQS